MRYQLGIRFLGLIAAACSVLFAQAAGSPQQGETELIQHAQELIRSNELGAAKHFLEDAVRRYPHSGGLYNLIGITAAEQNRMPEAKAAFAQAVKYSPNLVPALLNLGRILYQDGNRDGAIEIYQRALRLDNQLDEAHANLAALLLDKRDYRGVQLELGSLPARLMEQDRYRAIQCAAFAGQGEVDQARRALAEISGDRTEEDVRQAAFALAELKHNALLILMIEPVVKSGGSADIRNLLGGAYTETGEFRKARAIFEALAREQPKNVQPLISAGQAAYRQGDYEGAAGYLIHARDIEPNNADLQFFLGIVCINLNLPGDAAHALREAVRLKPNDASFNYALGAVTMTGVNASDAVSLFKKYVALRPSDPHGHLALGTGEFEAGDLEAARRELTPLLRDPAVAAGAHYVLGKISRRENDLEEAAEHFSAASRLDPSNAMLQANLAAVHIQQHKFPEGRRELDKALALEPDNYLANENLLLLLRKEKDPQAEEQAKRFARLTAKASEDQALLLRHIEPQR